MPTASGNPPLTGERTWPGIARENYWFMRHLACYRWAAQQLALARHDRLPAAASILDAGSGEGYGAAELSRTLERPVVAVEIDAPTAHHACVQYPKLAVLRGNMVALPFRTGSFRAAVSLQVVEHIWDPLTYLRELSRCTAGPVILSTPNRPVHSPQLQPGQRPDNPFHVREFDAVELMDVLAVADSQRTPTCFGLRHATRIDAWECEYRSLPHVLLLDSDESDPVHAFAASVTDADFVIEEIDPRHATPGVQDLVAIW